MIDSLKNGEVHLFLLEDCNNVAPEDTGKFQQDISIEYLDNSDSMTKSEGILYTKVPN